MTIKIGIAAHKDCEVPGDGIYLPLQVGAIGKTPIKTFRTNGEGKFSRLPAKEARTGREVDHGKEPGKEARTGREAEHGKKSGKEARTGREVDHGKVAKEVVTGTMIAVTVTRDDTGDNISVKNPKYCELTGLYWMWKNLDADYCGLVHYRRLFCNPHSGKNRKKPFSCVLDEVHLKNLLKETNIILPKKRNYVIESLYSHYAHSHYALHLDVTREILAERYPEYLKSFDRVMRRRSAHMFNMFIMKKDRLDQYCEWLFPVLFELDGRVDSDAYDPFQARFPGRVSELLLDVWLDYHGYSYRELRVIMIGRVQWGRKIASFLAAKFMGRRYHSGF